MRLRSSLIALISASAVSFGLAGCGSDSGDPGDDANAGESPTTTESTQTTDDGGEIDQAMLDERVADYQSYLVDEATTMLAATTAFTDAVRAGNVEEAKSLYADSRYHWETIEPLAGLVASVDGAVDSRVDDFANVDDPAFTGWHRLEYLLWEEGKLTPLSARYADRLDKDLAPLPQLLEDLDMTTDDVATGAAGLIEEVSEGKITGEEDRYSHTDLYDLAANINGSFRAFQTYEPVLADVDKDLENQIEQAFMEAKALLSEYQKPDGSYGSYLTFIPADKQKLQAILAGLTEDLSSVSGVLGQ